MLCGRDKVYCFREFTLMSKAKLKAAKAAKREYGECVANLAEFSGSLHRPGMRQGYPRQWNSYSVGGERLVEEPSEKAGQPTLSIRDIVLGDDVNAIQGFVT